MQQWRKQRYPHGCSHSCCNCAYFWKTCCSVLCPGLQDPSPKFHRKLTSLPALTRQSIVTVRFSRTDVWCRRRLSLTGFCTTSEKTSAPIRVSPLDGTKTTSYLGEVRRNFPVLQDHSHSSCCFFVSNLPGLVYFLVTLPEVVLVQLESPKSQRNSRGPGLSSNTARKVTSALVG